MNTQELLNKNSLTTAGVLVGSTTVLAGATLLTVALPAQVLTATGISAGLIYAGDRKAKNLPLNLFSKESPSDSVESVDVTAVAT